MRQPIRESKYTLSTRKRVNQGIKEPAQVHTCLRCVLVLLGLMKMLEALVLRTSVPNSRTHSPATYNVNL